MSILCPFCLAEHGGDICNTCPFCLTQYDENRKCKCGKGKGEKSIPHSYINAFQKGVAVYPIVTIGYKGCGKTTYLSSLIYSLYHLLPDEWISIRPLNQETIKKIEEEYVPALQMGEFPSPTDVVFEEPLILEIKIYKEKGLRFFRGKKEVILVVYDTKGGTYFKVDTIKNDFPLIKRIPNLILLIDLFGIEARIVTKEVDRPSPKITADMQLHGLVNRLSLALDELDASKKQKNLIICFTKADEFWDSKDAEEDFGPLAKRPPRLEGDMEKYCTEKLIQTSEEIEKKVKQKYNNFFEIIVDNYGGYFFVSSSNIGRKPAIKEIKDGNPVFHFVGGYNPMGVADPIMWLLSI